MTNLGDQLTSLSVKAPEGLIERVLRATDTGRFYDAVTGPTGVLLVGWTSSGIYGVAPQSEEARFVEEHTRHGLAPISSELPTRMRKQILKAIETGKLGTLMVDLSELTEFQQAVLRKTAEIPPGQLRPYGWVAREIGKPGATRAVGSALNKNPVPVLIPCHRVGRSDGTVGQYAYGPAMKRALLAHEGLDADAVDAAAERGVRFVASTTTKIYCHPTCHNARRIAPQKRVELRDGRQALAQGLRPCQVCRPAAAA